MNIPNVFNPNMYSPQPYKPFNTGINWVQGIEGAKAFQLAPNSNTILMDSESNNTFYIKICDSIGMCTLRTFKYEEATDLTSEATNNKVDMSQYITREEFELAISKLGSKNGKQTISTTNDKPKQQSNTNA